jgi:hypothetical protein
MKHFVLVTARNIRGTFEEIPYHVDRKDRVGVASRNIEDKS